MDQLSRNHDVDIVFAGSRFLIKIHMLGPFSTVLMEWFGKGTWTNSPQYQWSGFENFFIAPFLNGLCNNQLII